MYSIPLFYGKLEIAKKKVIRELSMVWKIFYLTLLSFSPLQSLEMRSLRNLTLQKIESMVDKDFSPSLLKKLIALPAAEQKALSHFLVRSDEKKRGLYKEVFEVHAHLELLRTFKTDFITFGSSIDEYPVAISTEARRIFLPTRHPGRTPATDLYILDYDTLEVLHTLFIDRCLIDISVSPPGDYFAVNGDLYDMKTYKLLQSYKLCRWYGRSTAIFFHVSLPLIFFEYNGDLCCVNLERLEEKPQQLFKLTGCTYVGNFPRDDMVIVASASDGIHIYDMRRKLMLREFRFHHTPKSIFFDPYGLSLHMPCSGGALYFCDLERIHRSNVRDLKCNAKGLKKTEPNYTRNSDEEIVMKSKDIYHSIYFAYGSGILPYGFFGDDTDKDDEIGKRHHKLVLLDIYDGYQEDQAILTGTRTYYCKSAINLAGNTLFTHDFEARQGYLHQIRDFEISLPSLLSLLFIATPHFRERPEPQEIPELQEALAGLDQLEREKLEKLIELVKSHKSKSVIT